MLYRSSYSWLLLITCVVTLSADDVRPLSPKEEQGTFRIVPGFRIDLVASEPDVVDPVAMCFDEKGRIYVCEMRGYPNGGVGTGNETRGRVRRLEDRDGDGTYETANTFVDGLRFPMGVTPWKSGVIVAVAPDILYCEDTDGDGKSDRTTVLYTGFNRANIQQMVNSLQWAPDGWIYGLAGNTAGTISSPQSSAMPPVVLGSRGFRFRPDVPGSLEPTSGGGQYGLCTDDAGHWFTATNSQHLRQIVLPDQNLRKNPDIAVSAVTTDIADHGPACKVFRISPFEPWRVERTTRRAGGTDAKRFPTTELIPGGFITSACSPIIYRAKEFPNAYHNSVFVCDPANNLIHRDVLVPNGSIYSAKRGEEDREFLASTDNWFRPVQITLGPDGCLYVLDFYREVIETPLSLPEDIKAKLNLESRGRGRIWRIAPADYAPKKIVDLSQEKPEILLRSDNSAVRLVGLRRIVELGKADVIALKSSLNDLKNHTARGAILDVLNWSEELDSDTIITVLDDPLPANRIAAIRLSESLSGLSPELRESLVNRAKDDEPHVRFQLILSASTFTKSNRKQILSTIIARDIGDPWMTQAVILSAQSQLIDLVILLLKSEVNTTNSTAIRMFLKNACSSLKAPKSTTVNNVLFRDEIDSILRDIATGTGKQAGYDLAVLEGLSIALRDSDFPLSVRLTRPEVERFFLNRFRTEAVNLTNLDSYKWLSFAPFEIAKPTIQAVLVPQMSPEIQLAAIRTFGSRNHVEVGQVLLNAWPSGTPPVRREILEQLLAFPIRTSLLLDALEKKTVLAVEIEPARAAQLKAHSNPKIRERAAKIFAETGTADRKKLIEDYRSAFELTGDAKRGEIAFQKNCAACHKLGKLGHDVGPNLLATVTGKSNDDILMSILDPNREVDSRYFNYVATRTNGRTSTGIIMADTAGAVTLKRSEGAEETIRRDDLDTLRSTGLSLMPDGMEKVLAKQDLADLLAFIRREVSAASKK